MGELTLLSLLGGPGDLELDTTCTSQTHNHKFSKPTLPTPSTTSYTSSPPPNPPPPTSMAVPEDHTAHSAVVLKPAICWAYHRNECAAPACSKLHLEICPKHLTTILGLSGIKYRPPCTDCPPSLHPSLPQTLAIVAAAISLSQPSMRLHATPPPSPPLVPPPPTAITKFSPHPRYFLIPKDLSPAAASATLASRLPTPLHVAIDFAYDDLMDLTGIRSLAQQAALSYNLRSKPEVREHLDLSFVSVAGLGSPSPPPASSSLSALQAAGLATWGIGATASSPASLPLPAGGSLIYLSPDATETLSACSASDVYVIGGLIDRREKAAGASLSRAAALGAKARRLPLIENLDHRRRCDSLDMLNVTAVLQILVEYAARRDWAAAIQAGLGKTQRGYGDAKPIKKPKSN